MAATTDTPTTPTPQLIDPTAVVAIDCNVGFYQGMSGILASLVAGRKQAEMDEARQQIEAGTTKPDTWQHHYLVVLTFIKAFETQIRQKNLYKNSTFEEIASIS